MDTNVQSVDQNMLVDMFPELGNTNVQNQVKPGFGMHVQDVDILKTPQSSTTEETTQTPDNQDDKKDDKVDNKVDEKTEVDILGENKALLS